MMHDDPVTEALTRHLGLHESAADYWSDYLAKLTFGSDPAIFDRVRDLENLERLRRALNTVMLALDLGAMTMAARDELHRRLIFGEHYDAVVDGTQVPSDDFNSSCTEGQKATYALRDLEENFARIRAAIVSTKRHIEESQQSRKGTARINFRGVQLVGAARSVWQLETGKEPPSKALDPASPFGKFLCDMFEAFEIEGNPVAAFRAWAAMA